MIFKKNITQFLHRLYKGFKVGGYVLVNSCEKCCRYNVLVAGCNFYILSKEDFVNKNRKSVFYFF